MDVMKEISPLSRGVEMDSTLELLQWEWNTVGVCGRDGKDQ